MTRYIDIDLNFTPHPVTGDILVVVDLDAIKRSIKHITEMGFENTGISLFDSFTPLSVEMIKSQITSAIVEHEPRVDVRNMVVTWQPEKYLLTISITFNILELNKEITLPIIIERK